MSLEINPIDLQNSKNIEPYAHLVNWSDDGKLFLYPPGNQHYKLLGYLSSQLKPGSKILEIGTRWGVSAVALASNKKITVTTCDLEDQLGENHDDLRNVENIEYVIDDGYNLLDKCHEYSLIFIDVDPHDGVQERKMIQKLVDLKYKGFVLMDDIHLNRDMIEMWRWIPVKKADLTRFGHYSGTGLLMFFGSDVSEIDPPSSSEGTSDQTQNTSSD